MLLLSLYLYSVCNNENGPKAALRGAKTKSPESKRKVFVIMKNSLKVRTVVDYKVKVFRLQSLRKKNFIKAITSISLLQNLFVIFLRNYSGPKKLVLAN